MTAEKITAPPITGILKKLSHKAKYTTANGNILPLTFNPDLPGIPIVTNDLTRKATLTGVTYLKQNGYRTRLTGNKQCAVDINGLLWLKGSELKAAIKPEQVRKKETRVETQVWLTFFNNILLDIKVSKNKYQPAFPLILHELFIFCRKKIKPPPLPRQYTIRKTVVRQRLLNYINSQNGKKQLFFFTVTFPKGTSDDIAYQIYNSWLTHLRKYNMLKQYLWVAERQENKTVHFHIAVPHYMDVRKANAMMAGTLKTFAKRGLIPYSVHACRKYNGVDIAKNRKTGRVVNFAIKKGGRALGNYLTKYITKNDGTFTHLAWHNSRAFSSVFTGVTFSKAEFDKNGFWKYLNFEKKFDSEFAVFIPWKDLPPPDLPRYLYAVNSFIQSQLNLN